MEYPVQPLTVDEVVARMLRALPQASTIADVPGERWTASEAALALARPNVDLDTEPPLRPWQGALRPVARATARAILFLSRFITAQQTRFNQHVLTAVTMLIESARRIDAKTSARLEQSESRLLELERTLWRLRTDLARLELPSERLSGTGADTVPDETRLEQLYVTLEDQFRGTSADIKERLQTYLPVLEAAGIQPTETVLDIGCGRGEWLDLLREQGRTARGIDRNSQMVARCRARDLDAVHADALAVLRGLPNESVAAVTAFHLVEHLVFPTVVHLFDETMRVLRRDGLLLVETPNPDDLRTATHDFYLDPTHRHPLPPALMAFLAEARGFDRIAIVAAQPDQPAVDYTLVARRP